MSFESSRIVRLGLISLLLEKERGVPGRKRIQKIMYFLDNLGWNAIPDYKFHHYGTYSESLAAEIQGMVNNGWIRETVSGDLYSYNIASDRRQIANAMVGRIRAMNEKRFEKSVKLIDELGQYSTDMLEVTSTLVYLKSARSELDNQRLVELARELKPQFTEDQFKKGLKIFDVLKKIE